MCDENTLKINLEGLDLSEDEFTELEERMKEHLLEYLKDKAKPPANISSLGPGWIGIER